MKKHSKFMVAILVCAASQQAHAQCNVPHTITNGEVADATEVMDNFNAVADCADEGVKPTGTPQAGELAVITGPKSVSGGDLSGDVTTSGSTQTTLASTGVVAGTYTNPSLTVDKKGRIVSATNGGAGSGGNSEWTEFVLVNPSAESGNTTGWTMTGGGFTAEQSNPSGHGLTPREGTYAFVASPNALPQMYQSVDLSTYATAIDAGTAFVRAEVLAGDTYTDDDQPWLYIVYYNGSGSQLSRAYSAQQMKQIGTNVWRAIAAESHIPANARSMRIYLRAERASTGTNNNIAFDAIRAFIKGF